jgi:hypothetical protein
MPLGSASVLNIYGYNSFETNPLNLHVLRQHSLKKTPFALGDSAK